MGCYAPEVTGEMVYIGNKGLEKETMQRTVVFYDFFKYLTQIIT